jgi:hypothetical protein
VRTVLPPRGVGGGDEGAAPPLRPSRPPRAELRVRCLSSTCCSARSTRSVWVGSSGSAAAAYCDEEVANREIGVWHFVIEKGY